MIQKSLLVLAEVFGVTLIPTLDKKDKGVCINSAGYPITENFQREHGSLREESNAFSTQATVPPLLVAGCLCLEVARQGFGSKSRQETMPLPTLVAMVAEIQDQLDRHVSKPALQISPKSIRRISLAAY